MKYEVHRYRVEGRYTDSYTYGRIPHKIWVHILCSITLYENGCVLNIFHRRNIISCVVIDPMHNLMLGTTKKMLKIWKEVNILNEKDFKVLQKRINKLKVPSSTGRIPSKIASSFKGFTADHFKNWALVFSTFALKDILPERHLQCWKLFVKACRILCSTVIPTSQFKLEMSF